MSSVHIDVSEKMTQLYAAGDEILRRLVGVDEYVESITLSLGADLVNFTLRPFYIVKFKHKRPYTDAASELEHGKSPIDRLFTFKVEEDFPHEKFVEVLCGQVKQELCALLGQHQQIANNLNGIIARINERTGAPAGSSYPRDN